MIRFHRWLQKLNQIITLIGGAAVSLMMLQVSLDVLMRFLFNQPLPGTITIVSHYYMIIAIFLPLAFVEQTKKSISIELLSNYFPAKFNRFLNIFSHLFVSASAFILAYTSFGVSIRHFHSKTSVMQGDFTIPTWPSYFILFIGVTLLGIYCLINFLLELTSQSPRQEVAND